MKLYADVIVNSDALDIDRPFTYEIPEEIIDDTKVGQWVKVPCGIKSKTMDGFILKIEEKDDSSMRIKKIKSIELKDTILTKDDIKLIDFIRDNYIQKNYKVLIIHGVGTGILRKTTHETLKYNKLVSSYKLDNFNSGTTIVEIRKRN